MPVETYEAIRKLVQSRRLLQQATDPSTVDRIRNAIDELERRLLMELRKAPPDQAVGQLRN
jgi:hypothetical protein